MPSVRNPPDGERILGEVPLQPRNKERSSVANVLAATPFCPCWIGTSTAIELRILYGDLVTPWWRQRNFAAAGVAALLDGNWLDDRTAA